MIRLFASLFKKMITFDTTNLENLRERADIDFSAAFAHGLLVAYCCTKEPDESWAVVLQPDIDPANESQKGALREMRALKQHIYTTLDDSELSFQPFFTESDSVRDQALATRDWVSGFWLGLQQTALTEALADETSKDFLRDLRQIIAMPLPEEGDAESLADLMEVQEYCRMGAVSLFLSLKTVTNRHSEVANNKLN